MAEVLLREGERLDELQRNGYKIIQDPLTLILNSLDQNSIPYLRCENAHQQFLSCNILLY
jgi:hypothetical protein